MTDTSLHDYDIPEGHYWGCTDPERPTDLPIEWWDGRCRRCLLRMEFIRRQMGDEIPIYVAPHMTVFDIASRIAEHVEMYFDGVSPLPPKIRD